MLNVCYATDDKFAMQTGISLLSLLENNKDLDICVYILANEISNDNKINLEEITKDKAELHFIDVSKFLREKIEVQGIASYNNSFDAYSRIFIAELLPNNISKILYIDGDTIINGNLMELAYMDINIYSCAMVKDIRSEKYKEKIGLENIYEFYNSGVIFINLDFWRKHNIAENLLSDILNFPTEFAENCALCRVLKGKIKTLPLSYNATSLLRLLNDESIYTIAFRSDIPFYSKQELNEARENPVILHFPNWFLSGRPWFTNCIDKIGVKIWDNYFKMSPWNKIFKKHRQNYGPIIWNVKIYIKKNLFMMLPEQMFIKKILLRNRSKRG